MHDVLGTLDLPDTHRGILRDAVSSLESRLADILHGLVLYGSAVRGGFVPAFSDLNLLIVLEVSTPEAHTVISDVVAGARVEIDPFVLAREGLERSFQAFAVKFDSIHRHYRVLSGADPLAGFELDGELAAFLTEQALRNSRLRAVQAFIHWRKKPSRYHAWYRHQVPVFMTQMSEVVRLRGVDVPDDFEGRLAVLADAFGFQRESLDRLLAARDLSRPAQADVEQLHRALFSALNHVIVSELQ